MKRTVKFLDLSVDDEGEKKDILGSINAVLKHGRIVLGPEVKEFEEKFAAQCTRRYAVGVGSGTTALFLALKALGIKGGDEVITTSLSWIATANSIALNSATPVFADVKDDLNIDARSVERLIMDKTKALMPVHFTGRVCNMSELQELSDKYGIPIIEDASQAYSSAYNNRVAGSFGKMGCFSLNPMKVLGAVGEAGVITLDDDELYEKLITLRYNGTVNKEVCIEASLNGRMDTLQAAVLLKKMDRVGGIVEKRRMNAKLYNELLKGTVVTPEENSTYNPVYYTYTIRAQKRNELKVFLEENGVEVKIQHPILMPEQPFYKGWTRGEYGNAKRIVNEILCLPANEKLLREEIEYVAKCIKEFYSHC